MHVFINQRVDMAACTKLRFEKLSSEKLFWPFETFTNVKCYTTQIAHEALELAYQTVALSNIEIWFLEGTKISDNGNLTGILMGKQHPIFHQSIHLRILTWLNISIFISNTLQLIPKTASIICIHKLFLLQSELVL